MSSGFLLLCIISVTMSQQKKRLLVFALLIIFTFGFFSVVDPGQLPVAAILVPFLLIFFILYLGVRLILSNFFRLNSASERTISFALSTLPVLLLIIQSITQLTIRDVLITVGILVIVIWYTVKINATT